LTAVALGLAGCGAPPDDPAAVPGPRFVAASQTPTEPVPSTDATPGPTKPAAKASPAPTAGRATKTARNYQGGYVFPVKASTVAFHPTHGKYPATDIFADCGEPVVAATSGVVLEISTVDRYVEGKPDGPYNGGLSVSLLGDDGVRYYGSHLSKVQTNAGSRVTAGQRLGLVGRTGNASGVCHLHFGVSPPCAKVGDWKVRRGVVWPATYLTSWRGKGGKSPVASVAAWERSHHCKA
jgi:murein DD-endopeptidase MepM/ murein hydrolase activator NlpD